MKHRRKRSRRKQRTTLTSQRFHGNGSERDKAKNRPPRRNESRTHAA